jgi:hypothetical protein
MKILAALIVLVSAVYCSGTEADQQGVGAECAADKDCKSGLSCLAFKGGYCGLKGCQHDKDCPSGSACVAHDDGANYCFLICTDKIQCNVNRTVELESNCSSNITFTDGKKADIKACVPPSGK